MYAGVVGLSVAAHPDFVECVRAETARIYAPMAERPGFGGLIVLADRESATAILMALFDHADQLAAALHDGGLSCEPYAPAAGFVAPERWLMIHCRVDTTVDPGRLLGATVDTTAPVRATAAARTVHVRGRPGPKFVEESRQALGILLPFTLELPGYLGGLALVDPESGAGTTLSLWETDDDLRRAAERARGATTAGTIALEADTSHVATWEVVLADVRATVSLDD